MIVKLQGQARCVGEHVTASPGFPTKVALRPSDGTGTFRSTGAKASFNWTSRGLAENPKFSRRQQDLFVNLAEEC